MKTLLLALAFVLAATPAFAEVCFTEFSGFVGGKASKGATPEKITCVYDGDICRQFVITGAKGTSAVTLPECDPIPPSVVYVVYDQGNGDCTNTCDVMCAGGACDGLDGLSIDVDNDATATATTGDQTVTVNVINEGSCFPPGHCKRK